MATPFPTQTLVGEIGAESIEDQRIRGWVLTIDFARYYQRFKNVPCPKFIICLILIFAVIQSALPITTNITVLVPDHHHHGFDCSTACLLVGRQPVADLLVGPQPVSDLSPCGCIPDFDFLSLAPLTNLLLGRRNLLPRLERDDGHQGASEDEDQGQAAAKDAGFRVVVDVDGYKREKYRV